MTRLPSKSTYVIIGAGIHGLSTAYHLALQLKQRRRSGNEIVILDKSDIGGGASGIACGVIRNNYFQPTMRELMAHSVNVWEDDPENYHYHPVGYMQISSESMHEDIGTIYEQQKAIGYQSHFIEGEADCNRYMKDLFHDWQAGNITSVLHELPGGYANNTLTLAGLAGKIRDLDVKIRTGVEVTSFTTDTGGSITSINTSAGSIGCDYCVIAPGPWARHMWQMLEMPETVSIKNPEDDSITEDVPMWVYWSLQEGTLGVDPGLQVTNDGQMPPVIHVDTDAPLHSDVNGRLITEDMWGIYYKPDFHFDGIQGGAAPFIVDKPADAVAVDPYGPRSPEFIVGPDFREHWVSALAHCQSRFSGTMPSYKTEPSGGLGAFTPDSFPIFDHVKDNAYLIADSNHGWKMIGVGKLVPDELMGSPTELLKPFRFSRYAEGKLHPVSNSPFPWS